MKRLIITILLLLWCGSAWGATYYVCDDETDCDAGDLGDTSWETGSDSGNCTGKGTPCKTIQGAVDKANGDDTIYVGKGTYYDSDGRSPDSVVRINGKDGIAIRAETLFADARDNEVIIDGQAASDTTSSTADQGIEINNSDTATIQGLKITRCRNSGIAVRNGSDDGTISQNWFYRNTWFKCTSNEANGNSSIYFEPDTGACDISRNYFEDQGRTDSNTAGEIYKHDHNIYLQGSGKNIYSNIFEGAFGGWCIKIDGSDVTQATLGTGEHSHIIGNNTFADPNNTGHAGGGHIGFYTDADDTAPTDLLIQNNAFYDPPSGSDCTPDIWTAIRIKGNGRAPSTHDPINVYNNVTNSGEIANEDDIDCHFYGPLTSSTYPSNYLTGISTNTTDLILANFGFNDPDDHDFTLAGSPLNLINSGRNTDAPSKDYYGNDRDDNAVDVGAFEYDSGGPIIYDEPEAEITTPAEAASGNDDPGVGDYYDVTLEGVCTVDNRLSAQAYEWDWDGGSAATDDNVLAPGVTRFTPIGTYAVGLRVQDTNDAWSDWYYRSVTVEGTPPTGFGTADKY